MMLRLAVKVTKINLERDMTEQEYIVKLKSRWPVKGETSLETLALADEAVRSYPKSARLWVIRGNLLELGSENCPLPLEESLACYKRAIEIDPEFAEAWEDAAHFYDAVLGDEQSAKPYFEQFEKL